MRYDARRDINQPEIVAALRDVPGISVALTYRLGQGYPDLTVGFRRANYLIEIKNGDADLTPDEKVFHAGWQGQIAIARTIEEALEIVGAGIYVTEAK